MMTRLSQKGFTLIELLIVISIIGIMLTVSLPVSFAMYSRYKASLKAQEIMVYISDLRRDSFLYSENKIMTSSNNAIMINENSRAFDDTRIRIDAPIEFYKNGTTSGGVISLSIGEYAFIVRINAPLGGLIMVAVEAQ
jgi:prepilin-type N-terminal cleavage/methylation domain-containing protein